MAKRTAQKQKAVGFTAANERTPKAFEVSRVTTFERPDLLILVGLTIVTFGIYAQVIGHRFITFDDPTYIHDNPMVNRGVTLAGLAWAFTTFYAGNWHPLTWIAHMIDSQLFGMIAGGHLLVNALIHVANTLLVFWFLLRTTHARWSSALVAALFALHPLHVESVAWAAERKDTLSTFFGLLSLIAYVRYAEAPSIRRYAWVAIMLALGLLAKPMLVTWPFVMLLLDYWPLRRFQQSEVKGQPARLPAREDFRSSLGGGGWSVVRSLVVEKIPLFALVAAAAVITFLAQSHLGGVRTFTEAPVALRLSNALVSYAKYLLLAFWPNDLAVYYPYTGTDIPAWQIIDAALLLIGVTAFCLSQRKIRPYLIVGWLWFLGTLVPVIGLVQVGGQTMADRYFYIPSIGLFIALVFGLADIAERRRVAPWLSAAIANVVLLVLAALTNAQIHRWNDSFTLFKHALTVAPPSVVAEDCLGLAMHKNGQLDEAVAHFEKALQIKPDDYTALLTIGVTRFYQGRVPEAMEYAQAAIRCQADGSKAHNLLGMALAKQNRNEAALDEVRRASALAPKDAEIRNNLGLALARLGRIPEAIDEFHEAVRLDPDNAATAHANLGWALFESGKPRESIPEFEAALQLNPEFKAAADGLRQAQAQLSPQR
ncbi:MAG TPA: tetratricopeptide repeat protein [Methylomirabilota bacterium]|nr:tetratricopeptide repeat protein [Methylomirabilota bacterium]